MHSLARKVLARFIEAAPVTAPYLQKLVAYMDRENRSETSEWRGSWSRAIAQVQRWAKQLDSDDTYEAPKTAGELFERLESRQLLDPTLLAQLKGSAPMPKATKSTKSEVTFYDAYRELEKLTGKPVIYEGSLEYGKNVPERLLVWARAFRKLKAPAKRALHAVVHTIHLSGKARGSEDASWDGQGKLRLVIKDENVSLDSLVYFVTHELGHGLEEKHHVDLFAAPWGLPPFISDYAASKPNVEDFAESWAHYVLSPSELKAKAAEKLVALKSLRL